MKHIFLILLVLVCATCASAQEVLSIDNSQSFVIIIDEGGEKYTLEDFLQSDQLYFLEGQKLEAHFFIRRTTSNPRDTYVLEMRTDLWNAEWQYENQGNITRFKAAKGTVWDSPKDHSAPLFEIVLNGNVPKPAIKIEEPYFKGYTGEGPGFRNNELAMFTVFDGHDAVTKVEVVGSYAFFSTNSEIERYLVEIDKNLDTSSLPEEYTDILKEQNNYIITLSKSGHVGMAFDLSKSYAESVRKLAGIPSPGDDDSITMLMLAAAVAIILGVVTGVIGYKVGTGKAVVSNEFTDQLEQSYNTLKKIVEKLDKIDIVNVPGAERQATELETVKRQISLSTAGLKYILNRLK